MSHYYSGSIRKTYTSERTRRIEQMRRSQRRENIKNWFLIAVLIACFLGAGYLDGQSLALGLIH